jgi:hypothetical protein
VVLGGSAALAFHLVAVAALVLSAPIMPWPNPMGPNQAPAPPFAVAVSEVTTRCYLMPLKMTHNYHFMSDRPGREEAYFEVRLKDAEGRPLETLKFPDDHANAWVRHRQGLLAQELTDDLPVQPRAGEAIPAPHQHVPTVTIWDMPQGGGELQLKEVPEHLVPRDRPVMRPSPWALLLARSYARQALRTTGAASAEVVRHWREPVAPALLFADEPPADAFTTFASTFGEVTR